VRDCTVVVDSQKTNKEQTAAKPSCYNVFLYDFISCFFCTHYVRRFSKLKQICSLSVRLSVTHMLWDKTKQCIADFWYHTKGQSL